MIDSMSVYDTQRSKLEECIVLASRIAACEADERIKRATVLYCMERTVDAFPASQANLISNNRDYIDSIDVNDVLADYRRNADSMSQSGSSMRPSLSHSATSPGAIRSGGGPLHCTLILFDDKLVIVKRQSASISGRTVTGLDNIDRLMKAGGGLNGLAQSGRTLTKDKLVFKGVVDVLDVIATDVGNCEFQLFFEKPPNDLGEKWSGRPSRHYQVVHPPLPVNLDYTPAKTDKQRFVQNLWKAQALARTRLSASARRTTQVSQSTALPIAFVSNNNRKLEGSDKPAGQAISFWNVWEKAAWNAHSRKVDNPVMMSKSTMATSVELDLVRKTPSPKRARQSTSPQNSGLQDLSGMSPKRDIFSIDEKQDDIDASKSGMMVDASDIDLEIQLDIARKNSVSVATSVYPSTHSVPGSMSVTRMEYQGLYLSKSFRAFD
ncbi:hypothetical protein QFC19_006267 [Naganishia cerealis]|uniref:Uncharacterized protein n=1 Tax=Naganishia cerealis TaxID=610337 RepID=A0ACC2VIR1_9TREE|nr:hypothetical protein QFC19_006267 [Naganishia cerealis]